MYIDFKRQQYLVRLLLEKGYTISCAESCTGGMFISSIIDIEGTSSIVNESYVTYSNEAKKRILGVDENTLNEHGAVSSETAFEMSKGLYNKTKANITVGITGIAGPSGNTPEKPVGLVYTAIGINGRFKIFKTVHKGNRLEVRQKTVLTTINNIIDMLEVENGKS